MRFVTKIHDINFLKFSASHNIGGIFIVNVYVGPLYITVLEF